MGHDPDFAILHEICGDVREASAYLQVAYMYFERFRQGRTDEVRCAVAYVFMGCARLVLDGSVQDETERVTWSEKELLAREICDCKKLLADPHGVSCT